MKVLSWNCHGWGKEKQADKRALLQSTDASIICLCETWLRGMNTIECEGYSFYGTEPCYTKTQE